MSRGVNRVTIIGNLGAEPDVRTLPSGDIVANISVATSESWRDKATGDLQERTEWHRIVFFGKLAEVVGQYLHKGSKVYVEGKLRTRRWTDQQNIERFTTEIIVDVTGSMQMLDSRPVEQSAERAVPRTTVRRSPPVEQQDIPFEGVPFDDDIPF